MNTNTPEPNDGARPVWRRPKTAIAALAAIVVIGVSAWAIGAAGDNDSESAVRSTEATPTMVAPPATTSPTPGKSASPSTVPTAKEKEKQQKKKAKKALVPTKTVPPAPPIGTKAVELGDTGKLGNGVAVTVSRIESVKGKGQGPGEISGPALRLTVKVDNDRSTAISTNLALVVVSYGKDRTPASELSGPGARTFGTSVAAGSSAQGRFVFGVPSDQRKNIQVRFSYTTKAPTVVFSGSARS